MSHAARHIKAQGLAKLTLEECKRMVGQAVNADDANNFRFLRERLEDIVMELDAPSTEQPVQIGVFTRGLNGTKPKQHKARAHLTLVRDNA